VAKGDATPRPIQVPTNSLRRIVRLALSSKRKAARSTPTGPRDGIFVSMLICLQADVHVSFYDGLPTDLPLDHSRRAKCFRCLIELVGFKRSEDANLFLLSSKKTVSHVG